MTKVLLIGATGMAGQEIYQAATKAGLAVTAQVRHADKARELFGTGVTVLEQDALTLSKDELANFDVVVNAFSTSPAEADNHQKLAEHLVHRLGGGQRLLVILGAGSLLDGADDHLLRNDAGESYTTAGTMAKAMVAEILHPAHHRERFTVANG